MFKTFALAALGFAAVTSGQFLDERNLQNSTATNATTTTAAPAAAAFTAACTVSTAGVETGCNTAGYCCAANTRSGTAPAATVPANLCVPTDFIGQNLTVAGTTYSFSRCLSANVTAAATVRTTCTGDDGCAAAQCCSNVTLTAGLTTGNGTATRKFCTAGTAATLFTSTYTAASWIASYSATVRNAACTPNPAPAGSFSSYIKASVMMVAAVLSVALF
jgi:hypothetical protein